MAQSHISQRIGGAAMRTRVLISLLMNLIMIAPALGQDQSGATIQDDALFLINKAKPYLYVVVDHVGPRSPLHDGEPNTGLWLRLINNCRLSIVVVGSKPPVVPGAEAQWVQDEIIPSKPLAGTESVAAGIGYGVGQDNLIDIFLSPNESEVEVRNAERAASGRSKAATSNRPHGYNDLNEPSPPYLNLIAPGGQMLISLPSNHISPLWDIQIPFRFALKHQNKLRQPYSYVALVWDDLSQADRAQLAAGDPIISPQKRVPH